MPKTSTRKAQHTGVAEAPLPFALRFNAIEAQVDEAMILERGVLDDGRELGNFVPR